jgi:hypothetical protein
MMQPRKRKPRTIRFVETAKRITCSECNAYCTDSVSYLKIYCTFENWMYVHAGIFHRTPESLRQAPARRKVLPMMAKRTTAEEYRKLRKQARRRRQFKGIKDKGQGASFRWM